MNSTEINAIFNIGDNVVYPLQGVGCILAREKRNSREYYRVQIASSEMDVLLPVEKASEIGLRHLASITEAKKALSSLSTKREMGKVDWKQRLLMNQELMKEGSIGNIATIVNILYHRQKVRDLPIQERRIFDTALTHLTDEMCSVLKIDSDKARRTIFTRLEKIG